MISAVHSTCIEANVSILGPDESVRIPNAC